MLHNKEIYGILENHNFRKEASDEEWGSLLQKLKVEGLIRQAVLSAAEKFVERKEETSHVIWK